MIQQKSGFSQLQKQSQQQRLSPQQIQYIKLLQLSSQHIEQRIKEEMESNPALEDLNNTDSFEDNSTEDDFRDFPSDASDADSNPEQTSAADRIDEKPEVDWDSYHSDDMDMEGYSRQTTYNSDTPDWQDIPVEYRESQLEKLEQQVLLLDFSPKQELIADQIIGSVDDDGYFRRDIVSVADGIAFQNGIPVSPEEVEGVLKRIQRLDPPGIAARNLRECLLIQLEYLDEQLPGVTHARRILVDAWDEFEKKHFEKIIRKLNFTEDEFRNAYECLRLLDPKPGSFETAAADAGNYITPDFIVSYNPNVDIENKPVSVNNKSASNKEHDTDTDDDEDDGDFQITMSRKNMPDLVVSRSYEEILKDIETRKSINKENKETHTFIKGKIESARWFIEMLRQRQQTLMTVMQAIVALQTSFFRTGQNIRPMILKDIAEKVGMDVSTISRVVNGKYVQTSFGVYELRYFFNEGITTDSGEEVSNIEVRNILAEIIENEPKDSPYSDQKLMELLRDQGFRVARRTVTKYREQLKLPAARMRKSML
ncbi:MAG: RNA polymerase sigma-54 factor [Balneolales bacterium]|nr:RNA polymerase sigma-54 factor [Balneolales bacterium]